MNCPICNVNLLMSEKQGIEIDYCPKCRGIWLDRGELEKIIERSTTADLTNDGNRNVNYKNDEREYKRDDYKKEEYKKPFYDDDDDKYKGGYQQKKKKSFLDDIFDF